MTDPTTQLIYVMQNEHGCIKIGRSLDPWQRRMNLRQSEHCDLEVVAAFEGGGEHEEAIHLALGSYRLEGEWFDGSDPARAEIAAIFAPHVLEWQFSHNPAAAANWLDHLRVVRAANYIRKAITREIGILRAATEQGWVYDRGVFWCRYLAETGTKPILLTAKEGGETVNVWLNPEAGSRVVLPRYTASPELALFAWPDDVRPGAWDGTAFDCCIAALQEIKSKVPKVPRPDRKA
jgi:hypothetical protein